MALPTESAEARLARALKRQDRSFELHARTRRTQLRIDFLEARVRLRETRRLAARGETLEAEVAELRRLVDALAREVGVLRRPGRKAERSS